MDRGVTCKTGTTETDTGKNGTFPILGFGVGIGCLEWGGG